MPDIDSKKRNSNIPYVFPKISIIMNCFNSEKYLREAIDSVYAQTFKDWEIIFWDNASTDKSAEIAKSYDSQLRYFRGDKNVPLGHARNFAIEKAQGEFTAILDCDDLWMPEKLEQQLPLFNNPSVGLVYSDVIQFNNRGYSMSKFGKDNPPQGRVFEAILFNNFICMSTAMIRSDVIKKHGNWFDTNFTAVEDTDLFIRISRDWDFAYAPYVLSKYRMHENSLSYSAPLKFRKEEELMLEKFNKIFPEFKDRYEARYRAQIKRDYAIVEWRQGNNSGARKIIKPLILQKKNYLLTYMAMFLPYKFAHNLRLLFSNRAVSNY